MTDWMLPALELAREAFEEGEAPVGCVIVENDRIVGRGRNRREAKRNALAHAEIEAIDEACRTLGGWRLWNCTLYVTLEPCPMCAGAIVNARVARVVYGARDEKTGMCGSVFDLFSLPLNHRPEVVSGVMAQEAGQLMTAFFARLRVPKEKWKKPEPLDALSAARTRIDGIDEQMTRLFARRLRLSDTIAQCKKKSGAPVRDAARERAVIERNLALLSQEPKEISARLPAFLEETMALSRALQCDRIGGLTGGLCLGRGAIGRVGKLLRTRRVLLLTADSVPQELLRRVARQCGRVQTLCLPENNRDIYGLRAALQALREGIYEQEDCLLAVGDEMLCGLGGIVAALTPCGIECCHIPTTLFAQAQAALGDKVTMRLAFAEPFAGKAPCAVWVDPDVLRTQPPEQLHDDFVRVNALARRCGVVMPAAPTEEALDCLLAALADRRAQF